MTLGQSLKDFKPFNLSQHTCTLVLVLYIFGLISYGSSDIFKGPDHNYGVQYKLKLNHAAVEKVTNQSSETIEGLETKIKALKANILHHNSKTEATLRPKVRGKEKQSFLKKIL